MGLRPPATRVPPGLGAPRPPEPAATPPCGGCAPRTPRGAGRVPWSPNGDPPSRLGLRTSPQTLYGMRAGGLRPPFLRTPRPHSRRGPCPCAGPLRRGAPAAATLPRSGAVRPPSAALRSPGPPPGLPPRLSRSGTCAALRASAATRWPRCAWVRLPLCCGRPSLCSGCPCSAPPHLCASRVPAGSPPARPLRGFGGGRLQAPGASGLRPLFPAPPPGPLAARPRLRGLAVRIHHFQNIQKWICFVYVLVTLYFAAAAVIGRFSPASPPPLPPPLGARGERGASGSGGSRPRRCAPPPVVEAASRRPSAGTPIVLDASRLKCTGCARS